MNLSGSKKGQFHNYMVVIIFLFVFGFISILGVYLMSNLITAFTDAGYYYGTLEETGDRFLLSLTILDYLIVIMMIAMIIGIGITSYKLNVAPIYFIVTLTMGALMGFVSYFFNYIFSQIVSQGIFDTVLFYFPRTLILCTNFHWIALAVIVIGSITLYAKKEKVGII